MSFRFEWNPEKARRNLRTHGVAFEEAATVFADVREMTMHDEAHSSPEEDRFVSLGVSAMGRLIVVVYCDRGNRIRIISARLATRTETMRYLGQGRVLTMKAEYDFSKAVRGKHAAQYAQGTNVVVIDPDVNEVFPDSKSVNDALRSIAGIIRSRTPEGRRKTLRRAAAAHRK